MTPAKLAALLDAADDLRARFTPSCTDAGFSRLLDRYDAARSAYAASEGAKPEPYEVTGKIEALEDVTNRLSHSMRLAERFAGETEVRLTTLESKLTGEGGIEARVAALERAAPAVWDVLTPKAVAEAERAVLEAAEKWNENATQNWGYSLGLKKAVDAWRSARAAATNTAQRDAEVVGGNAPKAANAPNENVRSEAIPAQATTTKARDESPSHPDGHERTFRVPAPEMLAHSAGKGISQAETFTDLHEGGSDFYGGLSGGVAQVDERRSSNPKDAGSNPATATTPSWDATSPAWDARAPTWDARTPTPSPAYSDEQRDAVKAIREAFLEGAPLEDGWHLVCAKLAEVAHLFVSEGKGKFFGRDFTDWSNLRRWLQARSAEMPTLVEMVERASHAHVRSTLKDSAPTPRVSPLATEAVLRPIVFWFAQQMEAQLRANDHKGGWSEDSQSSLLARVVEETEELGAAMRGQSWQHIVKEAADVANFALMIADNAAPKRRDAPPSTPASSPAVSPLAGEGPTREQLAEAISGTSLDRIDTTLRGLYLEEADAAIAFFAPHLASLKAQPVKTGVTYAVRKVIEWAAHKRADIENETIRQAQSEIAALDAGTHELVDAEELKRLKDSSADVFWSDCDYCRARGPERDRYEATQPDGVAHDLVCPKHPTRKAESERDAALRERDEARKQRDGWEGQAKSAQKHYHDERHTAIELADALRTVWEKTVGQRGAWLPSPKLNAEMILKAIEKAHNAAASGAEIEKLLDALTTECSENPCPPARWWYEGILRKHGPRSSVVLPERETPNSAIDQEWCSGWNSCRSEVVALNPSAAIGFGAEGA